MQIYKIYLILHPKGYSSLLYQSKVSVREKIHHISQYRYNLHVLSTIKAGRYAPGSDICQPICQPERGICQRLRLNTTASLCLYYASVDFLEYLASCSLYSIIIDPKLGYSRSSYTLYTTSVYSFNGRTIILLH